MTFDAERVFFEAQGARGTRLLAANELKLLLALPRSRGEAIHTVEAYELSGDDEIARIDLSLYGPADGTEDLPSEERLRLAEADVRSILDRARREGSSIAFQIWI